MKHSFIQLFCTFIVFAGANVLAGKHYAPNDDRAVELNTVKSLIFKKGEKTTGRRSSPVPQLSCIGGGSCGTSYEPEVVLCSNIGEDYATGDPTWKCTAELENGLRLGTTDVVCEGFRDRDDPWILRGSCGLEYTMQGTPVRTQSGNYVKPEPATYKTSHKAYPKHEETTHHHTYKSEPRHSTYNSKEGWVSWVTGLAGYPWHEEATYKSKQGWLSWLTGYPKAEETTTHHTYKSSEPRHSTYTASSSSKGSWMNWFAGLFLLWLFYRYIHASGGESVRYASAGPMPTSGNGGGGGFFGGNGGGGGGGRWGNPFGGWRDSFGGAGSGGGNSGNTYGNGYNTAADCNTAGMGGVGNTGGGGSGFWSGLGAGAGLGYLFGRRNNNNTATQQPRPRYTAEEPQTGGWRNWFGRTEEYEERPQEARRTQQYERTYTESPQPQVVNVGPATQTATGYGTTRRRG